MAQRREILAVYAAGVIQGVALVTFPAASAVFTSRSDYGLSSTEYGGMFVPQAVMAVVASVLGAGLRARLGAKHLYLLGLLANGSAMTLLVASRFSMQHHGLAYAILLAATTCMGVGFGFTVPALNTLAAAFFPRAVDRAVLGLNALLGLGTALAPVFIVLFVGLGVWWGLPLMVGGSIVTLLWYSAGLPLNEGSTADARQAPRGLPPRFWVFAAFTLLYGVCETMNGNWAALYMKAHFGAERVAVVAGADVLLGHGHRGPIAVCRARTLDSGNDGVPGIAIRGDPCADRQCVGADNGCVARHRDVRSGRAGLFGAAAAFDQLWPEGTDEPSPHRSRVD